tara:strand:+ start:835 stop:1242 length:408 start_codon:yes stop_codon:yes gene_type:complete
MKNLNVLILLCLAQIIFGQTNKTFVKSFNTYDNYSIMCDLPGELKVERWDRPYCQLVSGVKIINFGDNILTKLVSSRRYEVNINNDLNHTQITLPNIRNFIIVNGVDLKEEFIFVIKVPNHFYVIKKKISEQIVQ